MIINNLKRKIEETLNNLDKINMSNNMKARIIAEKINEELEIENRRKAFFLVKNGRKHEN